MEHEVERSVREVAEIRHVAADRFEREAAATAERAVAAPAPAYAAQAAVQREEDVEEEVQGAFVQRQEDVEEEAEEPA